MKPARAFAAIVALAAAALAACEERHPLEPRLSSFRVRITDPAEAALGTPVAPMDAAVREFKLSIEAIGADGQPYPAYQGKVDLRMFFLSGVNPTRKVACKPEPARGTPIPVGPDCAVVQMRDGKALDLTVRISATFGFGPSAFWVEGLGTPSFALGASQTLWRPPVTLRAIQETNHPAQGPLTDRQVIIEQSASPTGALVVTGVFAQSFSIYDTGEPSPWRSLLVYTFSQPARSVRIGTTVKNVSGTMQEFNGLTEVNFPGYAMDDATVKPERVPAPVEIAADDLKDASALTVMEPRESAPVRLVKWRVCWLNPNGTGNDRDWGSWARFQQWKVAPVLEANGTCPDREKSMSVISLTTAPAIKPVTDVGGLQQPYKGKVICRLDGILSQVVPNDDSCASDASSCINLWMTNPRGPEDVGEIKDRPEDCPPL